MKPKKLAIVGAGFSGATLAHELAKTQAYDVTVFESREHVGGNCHTERDAQSGVMVHTYGPHIFHTDREDIWRYVNQFGEFVPYVNRVRASLNGELFRLPVNLHTINQFYQRSFSPSEAQAFIAEQASTDIVEPQNFEEQALSMIGEALYQAFFYGYTRKQWGCEPRELPASLLKRLPLRFNDDDNYYADPWQGIPRHGYSQIVTNMLTLPNIEVRLNTPFEMAEIQDFDWVFYTGTLDGCFDFAAGRLGYRTVYWEERRGAGDMQGHAVINYPSMDVPYTRVHEHKHFAPWENHSHSICFEEYSKETGPGDIPYYPKRLPDDMRMLAAYETLAQAEPKTSFLGRLATYRYMDMHHVIAEAHAFAAHAHAKLSEQSRPDTFPHHSSTST